VWHEKQVQARFFLGADAQKTGTGNAVVAVPVPAFCAGITSEKTLCLSLFFIILNKTRYV